MSDAYNPYNPYNIEAAARLEAILTERESILTEIEGMKAENQHRANCGDGVGYADDDFAAKSAELRALAAKLEEFRA